MPELHERADGVGPYRARTPFIRAAVYVIRDRYSRDRPYHYYHAYVSPFCAVTPANIIGLGFANSDSVSVSVSTSHRIENNAITIMITDVKLRVGVPVFVTLPWHVTYVLITFLCLILFDNKLHFRNPHEILVHKQRMRCVNRYCYGVICRGEGSVTGSVTVLRKLK